LYTQKPLPFDKELGELRKNILSDGQPAQTGNQTFSQLRGLKQGETFAVNGIYLHEWFFGILGGDGDSIKGPELAAAISEKWGSVENFIKYFTECAMAARGWAILAWDPKASELKQYNGDAHNQAVWGCIPVIALDVYEHAYFIDHGSDRKAYVAAFFKNLNWETANELFKKVSQIRLA